MKPVLVDTGPLVALIKRRDASHERCVRAAESILAPLLTTWAVVTEAAWLLRHDDRDVDRLLQMIDGGDLQVVSLDRESAAWTRDFLRRFADQRPQLADATLMYLAEVLGIDCIFTLDRRDFSVFRLTDGSSVRLIPDTS